MANFQALYTKYINERKELHAILKELNIPTLPYKERLWYVNRKISETRYKAKKRGVIVK